MVTLNPPFHVDAPGVLKPGIPLSLAMPDRPIERLVPVAPRGVNTKNEVTPPIEHETVALVRQFVEEPGATVLSSSINSGCAWNCRKVSTGKVSPPPEQLVVLVPKQRGFPLLTKIPSRVNKQPAVPRTPVVHPINFRFVPVFTSAFHGGPGTGKAAGSGLHAMLIRVKSVVPDDPDPTTPITLAEAVTARTNTSKQVEAIIWNFMEMRNENFRISIWNLRSSSADVKGGAH
jgi:hypothetical protein